jgi:hypothetical protein
VEGGVQTTPRAVVSGILTLVCGEKGGGVSEWIGGRPLVVNMRIRIQTEWIIGRTE